MKRDHKFGKVVDQTPSVEPLHGGHGLNDGKESDTVEGEVVGPVVMGWDPRG